MRIHFKRFGLGWMRTKIKLRKKIIWLKERPRIRVSTTVKYKGRKSREYCVTKMYIGKRRTARFRRKTPKRFRRTKTGDGENIKER